MKFIVKCNKYGSKNVELKDSESSDSGYIDNYDCIDCKNNFDIFVDICRGNGEYEIYVGELDDDYV